MRPSLVASVNYIARNPEPLLQYLKQNDLPIFHKSNVFFRDFQYGLWRYLDLDQVKTPYAELEEATNAITDILKGKGLIRQINRNAFEVNMPVLGAAPPPPAAPAPKAGAAAPVAAAEVPAATASAAPASGGGAVLSEGDKAAKIADLKRRMAEARARTLAGG